jgi:hypothetical protein
VSQPPNERARGWLLANSVAYGAEAVGYVVPQYQAQDPAPQQPAVAVAAGTRRQGRRRRRVAGWACDLQELHCGMGSTRLTRRGVASGPDRHSGPSRSALQSRWLPTQLVDSCCPPAAVLGQIADGHDADGTGAGAGGCCWAVPGEVGLETAARRLLAIMVQAAEEEEEGEEEGEGAGGEGDDSRAAMLCSRANALARTVGRQHWAANAGLALLIDYGLHRAASLFGL